MNVSRFKAIFLSGSFLLLSSLELGATVVESHLGSINNTAQMVNLNLQIKTKNKVLRSDLTMPFYQTAELERKFGDKRVLIELNPRRGKNVDEIALEMKFYNSSGPKSKAFYKKEIVAKVNQESRLNFQGMSVRVTPVL